MCLPFCRKETRWGSGPGPVAVGQKVVYFGMTDWRWFGRAHDLSERKIMDVITQRQHC